MHQSNNLEALLEEDTELASLPEIFIRVSELLDDDNSSSAQIGMVVESDPSLSSRILKMVNSAFFGFPKTIASISQAISILGRDRIRQILIGVVIGGIFGDMKNKAAFMEGYWKQSVKTAILSRLLSKESNIHEQSEILFTAGLLHQLGRLILLQKLPEQSKEIEHGIESLGEDLYQAEQRVLGFTHCEVGAAFINKWGLPEILSEIAGHYHDPSKAQHFRDEARMVHVANRLSFLVAEIEAEELQFALDDIPEWEHTGLDAEQILDACLVAEEQVYMVMESLGMVQMTIDMDDD